MKIKCFLFFALISFSAFAQDKLPEGFVYLKNVIPDVIIDARYYSTNNFLGIRVDGYKANVCILTNESADALKKMHNELQEMGLSIKVFDGYRPQMAVDHFVRWAKDISDTLMKKIYYPEIDKRYLFRDGYIASKSSHTRGSTVDLTLIDLKTAEELDMGTDHDYFGVESWPKNLEMTIEQRANRMLLRTLMIKYGFIPYDKEWWHFTFRDEPYKDKYFNFEVFKN